MNAIEIKNLSKKYTLTQERPVFLKSLFFRERKEEIWALKDINLEIKKGETIGIIGENGSGKSTLLKILAGITTPTDGDIKINGQVSSLIELGAGFHPDLTGKENIYLNGSILGLTKKEIDQKLNQIIDFANIGDFIDTPVSKYSSGMSVRLGFAVAVHLNPDILLVDEVLAVGDESFQRKCFKKISEFKKQEKTILFVSHNLIHIESLCNRVVWLDEGEIGSIGKSSKAIASYLDNLDKKEEKDLKRSNTLNIAGRGWGTGEALITEIKFLDGRKQEKCLFKTGEEMIIKIKIKFSEDVKDPIVGFIIYDTDGGTIYATNTQWKAIKLGNFKKGSTVYFQSNQKINLLDGTYFLTVAIAHTDALRYYDLREKVASFKIVTNKSSQGVADLQPKLSILRKES